MEIACVLCTYNGADYLYEQLNSLKHQSRKLDKLIICDDGSTDNTLSIIEEWKKNVDFTVEVHVNENSLGACKNFAKALSLTMADYVFFSDQDDVWLPDKIEISIKKILAMEEEYGREIPCLVHTDLEVVDEGLNTIHKSFLKNQGLSHISGKSEQLRCLMVQNFVTGCTVVINRALCEKALPFPHDIIMHDFWLALVASLVGKLGFVDKATILYRQHGHNAVGAVKYLSIANILKVLDRKAMLTSVDNIVKQLRVLCAYKGGSLVANNKCVIQFVEDVEGCNYLRVLLGSIHKQGRLINVVFRFYMMVYMYRMRRL